MGDFYVDDQKFLVGIVDLSTSLVELTVTDTAPLLDNTTQASDNGSRRRGKSHYVVQAKFLQDYAAANVDATLQGVIDGGGSATMTFKSANTGGKEYTGVFAMGDYEAINGNAGQMAEFELTLESAGNITVTTPG